MLTAYVGCSLSFSNTQSHTAGLTEYSFSWMVYWPDHYAAFGLESTSDLQSLSMCSIYMLTGWCMGGCCLPRPGWIVCIQHHDLCFPGVNPHTACVVRSLDLALNVPVEGNVIIKNQVLDCCKCPIWCLLGCRMNQFMAMTKRVGITQPSRTSVFTWNSMSPFPNQHLKLL